MTVYKNTGLVIEGEGFRAIFVAAVLEVLQQQDIFFSYTVGVSAGAAYGASYITKQQGRNLQTNYLINNPDYCGVKHLLKNGNYFNWEYIYKTIPTGIIPLKYDTLKLSETKFEVAVTNCQTGTPFYFNANTNNSDILRDLLTATSSLPFIAKPKNINSNIYFDGGLADAIPVKHALQQNNSRVVIILTRPFGYIKKASKSKLFFSLFYSKYPKLVDAISNREKNYNACLQYICELEKQGKAFVIRPNSPIPIGRLQNNPTVLANYYNNTVINIKPVIDDLKNWLAK